MINNGVTFGLQGPMMEGTWYNPVTNDSFTVRDSYWEDGQYMVSTMDGRILGYELIQNYIKSDKPINFPKKPVEEKLPAEVANLVETETDNLMLDDEMDLITTKPTLGNINKNTNQFDATNINQTTSLASNTPIIAKALSKYPLPEIDVDVKWDNYPTRQIEMLKDVLDINPSEIVEWYASQLDMVKLATAIHESLLGYIVNKQENVIVIKDTVDTYNAVEEIKIDEVKPSKSKAPKAPKAPKATKKSKK